MNFSTVLTSFHIPQGFSKYFEIKLIKNRIEKSLLVQEHDAYLNLQQFLRQKCILLSFHEEFTILKSIGKGSFAKVFHKKKEN